MAAEQASFPVLMDRVRSGDQQAAAELVRVYEPHIRRMIRVRLTDPGLKRQMDSVDICPSVLGSFFVRSALGQFELESPEQLIKLLAECRNRMTREDRYLAEQRGLGRSWNDLAHELGGTPDALRMRLTRTLDQLAADLGIDRETV